MGEPIKDLIGEVGLLFLCQLKPLHGEYDITWVLTYLMEGFEAPRKRSKAPKKQISRVTLKQVRFLISPGAMAQLRTNKDGYDGYPYFIF
jgi:hypothetical protein